MRGTQRSVLPSVNPQNMLFLIIINVIILSQALYILFWQDVGVINR